MTLIEKIKDHVHTDLQGVEDAFYKTANIYRRPDGYYFIPLSATEQGGVAESTPIIKQNAGSRLASLGDSLLSCLLQVQQNRVHSEHVYAGEKQDDLSQLANTQSDGSFHHCALAVLVQCYFARIVFHPMCKNGSRSSYYGNPEAIFEISTDLSVNELGKALRTSFQLAER